MVLATLAPIKSRTSQSLTQHTPDRVATATGTPKAAGWRAGTDAAAGKSSRSHSETKAGGGSVVGGPVGGLPAMEDGEKPKPQTRQKRGAPAEAAPEDDADAAPPAKRQQVRQASSGANGEESAPAVTFGVAPWAIDLDVSASFPATSVGIADGLQTIQKDAILKQLKETKREKSELQEALDRVQPKKRELEERFRIYDIALDQVSSMIALVSTLTL
jgi:hypothetical protein